MPTIYTPHEGYVPNPLRGGELRNMLCLCESGKKVKKCCGRALFVEKDWADMVIAAAHNDVKRFHNAFEKYKSKGEPSEEKEPVTPSEEKVEEQDLSRQNV